MILRENKDRADLTRFCVFVAYGRNFLFCRRSGESILHPVRSASLFMVFRSLFAQRGGFPGNFQTRVLRVLSAWCLYCTFFKTFQQDAERSLRIIETLFCTFQGGSFPFLVATLPPAFPDRRVLRRMTLKRAGLRLKRFSPEPPVKSPSSLLNLYVKYKLYFG